jgi:hypothetical protein
MPRPPNPNAKTNQVLIKARDQNEVVKVGAFKELCARNGLAMNDVLMDKITEFLRQHNWPPGNSQTLLQAFGPELRVVCMRCQKSFRETEVCRVVYKSGWEASSCVECLKKDKGKGLVKKVGKQT